MLSVMLLGVLVPLATQETTLMQQGWNVLRSVKAPDARIKSSAGDSVRFSRALPQDEITIVNFWATWCAPCVQELPDLQRLNDILAGAGIRIILINAQENPLEGEMFLERLGITLSSYYDVRGRLGRKFGTRGLPVSFIINRDQQVFARYVGLFPWDSDLFVDALRKL